MKIVCPECQYVGKAAKKKRGSDKLATAAWFVFPFGLPYTLWRMFSKTSSCKHCGSTLIIPADGPVGKRLLASFDEKLVTSIAAGATPSPAAPAAVPSVMTGKPVQQPAAPKPAATSTAHNDPNVW